MIGDVPADSVAQANAYLEMLEGKYLQAHAAVNEEVDPFAYLPERTVTDNNYIPEKSDLLQLKLRREERLASQIELERMQFMHKQKAFENHVAHLRCSGKLAEDVIINYETEMMEDLLDMDLSSLKIAAKPAAEEPVIEKLADEEATLSPTEIARRLRSNAYAVGCIISKLGIRGDERYSREITTKARRCNKKIPAFLYKPCVVGMIAKHLRDESNRQQPPFADLGKFGLGSLNGLEVNHG